MARAAKKETLLTTEEKLAKALVPEEEQPYPVPENWCWVRLGTVIESVNEKTDIFDQADLKYVGLENIEKDTGKIEQQPANEIKSTKNVFREGDILYGKLRPYLNKHGIVSFSGVCSTDILVFRAKLLLSNKLVDYFFHLPNFIEYAVANSKGINLPRVSEKIVLQASFPLPPLPEQQRIVTLIESLFADLDAAKKKLQAVLDGFAKRRAALLHKAFTGELTREWRAEHRIGNESWIETPSAELFEYVTSGSRGWAQYYADTGAIFLRIGNLDHGTIELDISDIQHVDLPDKAEGQRSRVKKGDILISITADVGMIAYIKEEIEEAYINQHIALARPKKANDSEFIAWYFVSDVGLNQLQHMQRGTTKVGLTLQDIKSVYLKMPCLEEQKEIVRILDDIFAKESQSKAAVESALAKIDTMKKAILATAFRGGFRTNDSSDESAVELLRKVL